MVAVLSNLHPNRLRSPSPASISFQQLISIHVLCRFPEARRAQLGATPFAESPQQGPYTLHQGLLSPLAHTGTYVSQSPVLVLPLFHRSLFGCQLSKPPIVYPVQLRLLPAYDSVWLSISTELCTLKPGCHTSFARQPFRIRIQCIVLEHVHLISAFWGRSRTWARWLESWRLWFIQLFFLTHLTTNWHQIL
jgi:hypothetical protein